MTAPSDFGQNH